jgi:hypothetical protein
MTALRSFATLILCASGLVLFSDINAHAQNLPDIKLTPPIDCVIGETCWIVNYFDHDPSRGHVDYTGGPHSYDRHRGTDFGTKHLKAMRGKGVSVIASAPGVVLGVRDGMRDISVRELGRQSLDGKDCGNGVSIDHGDGLVTQYCHMRNGSVTVSEGQMVERGAKLGLVGLSGNTEFPHVHLTVRFNDEYIDPFAPKNEGTGTQAGRLWSDAGRLDYSPAVPYIAGFAGDRPTAAKVRAGDYDSIKINRSAPALVFWSDSFNLRNGDSVEMVLKSADGSVLSRQTKEFDSSKVRWFMFIGKRTPAAGWPAGRYTGHINVVPAINPANPRSKTVSIDIE